MKIVGRLREFGVVFIILTLILAGIYQLEKIEDYIQQHLKFIILIIVPLHWFFFFSGCMLVGLPFTFPLRKLYLQACSRLPKELRREIEKSRKEYFLSHKFIDYFLWISFLPAFLGLLILYIILPLLGIDVNLLFPSIFYYLPFAGIFYLSFVYIGVIEEILKL